VKYQVLQGDCLKVLRSLKDQSVDSVVSDPPYALNFMGKEWDSFAGYVERNGSSRAVGDDGGRHDEGYRNMRGRENEFQSWCERWASECLRVLKPGGHLLAFGGTRTYHRMTCGIEDAGFEIRDSLHWIYGSGFPKSMDVSKAIDKAAGVQREVISEGKAVKRMIPGYDQDRTGSWIKDNGREFVPTITAAATEDAARWEGWGTALKPAHEPIVVARKPLAGTVAANVLAWGTGGLNIDASRVEGIKDIPASPRRAAQGPAYSDLGNDPGTGSGWDKNTGRWPPNILLSEEAAAEMDRQTGTLTSGSNNFIRESSADFSGNTSPAYGAESRPAGTQMISYGDTGGASRFFPCFKYQAKASPSERPRVDGIAHPTCKPVALMRWLVKLVTPPEGIVLDPFAGTGTTAEACLDEGFRCILIERDEDYLKLIRARMNKRPPSLFD
jgi:DNA modification methylase